MLKLPGDNLTEFPGRFPEQVEQQAQRLAKNIDFRDELFEDREEVSGFTLDAADSPDLDDAIWLRQTAQGWLIQVTISDVDALIKKDSYIDIEALSRVTSHYFPEKTNGAGRILPKQIIPMLPKVLSENKLSLLQGKLRPTLTAEIHLSPNLQILSLKVKKTYLRSARRLGLREYGGQKIISDPGLPLRDYYQMAKALNRKRWSEESLAFQEIRDGVSTDEDGRVGEGSISAASLIVQEFMVLANQAVAQLMKDQQLAVPFRNHQPARHSPPTRLQIIREIEKARDYLVLVDNIRAIYNKFLSSAVYEPESKGHFGLGLTSYLHFTSPIRRYADLVVHRAVKALIDGEAPPYSQSDMSRLCHHLNQRQRRLATLRATRDGTNSLNNYRVYGHLLQHDLQKQPDYMENLLAYLWDNRIGNAYFEFTASDGINIELKCRASVRYQRLLHQVTVTARTDKLTVKNEAARLLLKEIRKLVAQGPAILPSALKPKRASAEIPGVIANLYNFCEQRGFDRPSFHYEAWNGGALPLSCHCQIDESLSVIGYGDSRIEAKTEAATKLLTYLQSGQHITPRRSLPPTL